MSPTRASSSDAEWQCRVDLAAAYRLMDYFGVRDLTYNHLSARVPGKDSSLLIKRSDFMFGEVTASNLVKYSLDGRPALADAPPLAGGALCIHAGLMALRLDINAIFHTDTVANMALAAQADGLLPITQHALLFYGRVAYHDFTGFEFEPGMEQALAANLGTNNVAGLPSAQYVLGNEVAFETIDHFNAAMASTVRHELRAHYHALRPIVVATPIIRWTASGCTDRQPFVAAMKPR